VKYPDPSFPCSFTVPMPGGLLCSSTGCQHKVLSLCTSKYWDVSTKYCPYVLSLKHQGADAEIINVASLAATFAYSAGVLALVYTFVHKPVLKRRTLYTQYMQCHKKHKSCVHAHSTHTHITYMCLHIHVHTCTHLTRVSTQSPKDGSKRLNTQTK
jgi:hypothetical protein